MKRKRLTRDPVLLEVAAAIGAGRITIGPIHDDDSFTHGYSYGNGHVRIYPALEACDTAIHEILHRIRPTWSERAIRAKTTHLMRQMSYQEIDTLYELVLARAQTSRTPERFDG